MRQVNGTRRSPQPQGRQKTNTRAVPAVSRAPSKSPHGNTSLTHGAQLRNMLAMDGAARIQVDKKTEAMFAVDSQYVHVSSRRRGAFIYDTQTHRMK